MNKALPSNRSFGWTFTAVFALAGGAAAWKGGHPAVWFAASAAFAAVTLIRPQALAPLNRLWMAFAELLHRLVSPVVLGLMFFGVFMPVGLLMRLSGRDPMRRKVEPAARSYWIDREPPGPPPESLREQF